MFGLGTFSDGQAEFAGLVVEDTVIDLREFHGEHVTTRALLQNWPNVLDGLEKIAASASAGEGIPREKLRALPPVSPSGQIFCAGANYYTHTVEMTYTLLRGNPAESRSDDELQAEAVRVADRVRESGIPFVFTGQPSALAGAEDDIVLWGPGVEHDWELEFAVVIGKEAHCIDAAQAMDHVAGYTMCNDISTRDVMFRAGFALSDFLTSKNRPTFFPMGPYILPAAFVPDYRALHMQLKVNGEVMQDGNGEDLIYGVEELVSYVSHVAKLLPGDIVLTGSPAGNAAARGNRWLTSGDIVEATISGMGIQRNVCVPDPR